MENVDRLCIPACCRSVLMLSEAVSVVLSLVNSPNWLKLVKRVVFKFY